MSFEFFVDLGVADSGERDLGPSDSLNDRGIACFRSFCLFALRLGGFEVGFEVEESLEVVGGGHQFPFQAGFLPASHAHLSEPHRAFDDAENGLHCLLA